jgi:membrane-bound serine protease (ClpP class)
MLLVEGPPEMRIRLSTALAVSVPFAFITVFLVSLVVRARVRPAETGSEGLLREMGVAQTDLDPDGTVLIHGELWNARAGRRVERGARVRVKSMDGLRLEVEAAETPAGKE